jgi:hypothetical protein
MRPRPVASAKQSAARRELRIETAHTLVHATVTLDSETNESMTLEASKAKSKSSQGFLW